MEETTIHVLQCPHLDWTAYWHQLVESGWCWQTLILPSLDASHHYSAHMRHRVLYPVSHITLSTCSFQSVTNWLFYMLLRCLSPWWEVVQAEHWSGKQCKWSPQHWAHSLCLQLLHLTHSTCLSCNQLLQDHSLPCSMHHDQNPYTTRIWVGITTSPSGWPLLCSAFQSI